MKKFEELSDEEKEQFIKNLEIALKPLQIYLEKTIDALAPTLEVIDKENRLWELYTKLASEYYDLDRFSESEREGMIEWIKKEFEKVILADAKKEMRI